MELLQERATRTWIGLVALTCVTTWGLRSDGLSSTSAVVGILVIAAVKVGLVMSEFMELRLAPWQVRIAFGAWVAGVTAGVLGFWLATPAIV
jgi:heme/copper-type cytochrome/quinol oxidase subunit 4